MIYGFEDTKEKVELYSKTVDGTMTKFSLFDEKLKVFVYEGAIFNSVTLGPGERAYTQGNLPSSEFSVDDIDNLTIFAQSKNDYGFGVFLATANIINYNNNVAVQLYFYNPSSSSVTFNPTVNMLIINRGPDNE